MFGMKPTEDAPSGPIVKVGIIGYVEETPILEGQYVC